MKALILNSGTGSRMGEVSKIYPKCMTRLEGEETILRRQLILLEEAGVSEVVITTGYFDKMIRKYCEDLKLNLTYKFVCNPEYKFTNYIYSIYLSRNCLDGDIVLLHGDLVFDKHVLGALMNSTSSCMVVDNSAALPEKDFKAVLSQDGNNKIHISKIGIEFFENAVAAQPLYKLLDKDKKIWMEEIRRFCLRGERKCYAENAFNNISDKCFIQPLDIDGRLCSEIDTEEDLKIIKRRLDNNE